MTKTARDFVYNGVDPYANQIEEEVKIPHSRFDKSKEMGLFGLSIPEEYGGLGYMQSYPIERFYHDARISRIYEGTSEIQKNIIAAQIRKAYNKKNEQVKV